MSDVQHEIKNVNWKEVLGFSNVFRSFRMAIHLSKLVLGLAVVTLVYLGGYALQATWCLSDDAGYVPVNAIGMYYSNPAEYEAGKAQWLADRPTKSLNLWVRSFGEFYDPGTGRYAEILSGRKYALSTPNNYEGFRIAFRKQCEAEAASTSRPAYDTEELRTRVEEDWGIGVNNGSKALRRGAAKIEKVIRNAAEIARTDIESNDSLASDARAKALAAVDADARKARYALTKYRRANRLAVNAIQGEGVFETILSHELTCLSNATVALCRGSFTEGTDLFTGDKPRDAVAAGTGGVLYWMLMAGIGIKWLISQHTVFAILLSIWALAVWALLGGAIYRMAALQAAREEKISVRQAIRFSISKFFSFLTAPLIPLALIALFCGLMALGGVILGNWWSAGSVLVGALLGLSLLLGLVVAFLTVGLVTGGGLMYPTIAVEGSDSFDAISRSFSYVFARPWRAGLYAGVALVHGALCYVFIRAFAFVTLKATHLAVKLGVWGGGRMGEDAVDRIDVLWPAPTFDALHGPINWDALDGVGDMIGAGLVSFWVHIVIGLVAAFVLTYVASSTTVIYYLLRRKIDATDLDDVYIEEEIDQMPQTEEEPSGEDEPADEVETEDQESEGDDDED